MVGTTVEKTEVARIEVMPTWPFLNFRIVVEDDEKGDRLLRVVEEGIKQSKDAPQSKWHVSMPFDLAGDYAFLVLDVLPGDAARFYIWLHEQGAVPPKGN